MQDFAANQRDQFLIGCIRPVLRVASERPPKPDNIDSPSLFRLTLLAASCNLRSIHGTVEPIQVSITGYRGRLFKSQQIQKNFLIWSGTPDCSSNANNFA